MKTDKLAYLRETFGRMANKTFENYVCNRIWSRLDNLDLKPVTQQYVKRYSRQDGKEVENENGYALIDLYFPQIRFAVEVNEKHHIHNKDKDKEKMDDIKNAVDNIECFKIWEAGQDGRTLDIDDIHRQIEDAVTLIKARIVTQRIETGEPLIWDDDEANQRRIAEIRERGVLSAGDDVYFNLTVDALNELFDKNYQEGYARWGRTVFLFGNSHMVWFAPIGHDNNDWKNEFASGKNEIIREWRGEGPCPTHENYDWRNIERAVFAQEPNELGESAWRFTGIYRFDRDEGNIRRYKRVSTELPFSEWREDRG